MIKQLQQLIDESEYIVFLGGAGVSTESGIGDFRSENGLYNQKNKYRYPPEQMLSRSFFDAHKPEFFEFYREKMIYPDAQPNKAHYVLAELEKKGKLKAVITQNVDGLHQLAGSRNVLEIHGSISRNYCMKCRKVYGLDYMLAAAEVPYCECGGVIKPDIVLYEEALDPEVILSAVEQVCNCDLLIVGGTSLNVYPAAGLLTNAHGKVVIINNSETPFDDSADLVIHQSLGAVLGSLEI